MTLTSEKQPNPAETLLLLEAGEEALQQISAEGLLSLTLEEMKAVQGYFQKRGRNPTDVELETIAQTWSEHCYHKTFKAAYTYREENVAGGRALAESGPRTYQNLFKETIVKATESLSPSFCLSVFKDNAGVIRLDDQDAVSFKVETHNHPSALEPYGGAGTGIGGVIRDIMGCGLGGKPVLNTDVFCFGDLTMSPQDLPEGCIIPRLIAKGVISGVRDYGNRMGIPTANGAVYFDPGYGGNPLVFCGTVGLMPVDAIAKTVLPGDLAVAVGGRTGRDGVHGATFSSAPLQKGLTSNVVQIGHAIMEKKMMDVLLVARDRKLYRSITDCGAGGLSSAVGEMGAGTGVQVQLEQVPLKYPGLMPWEVWVSESQERMVLAVPPEKWTSLSLLFQQEDVEATVIGLFTDTKKLNLTWKGELVADIDMDFLHDGLPQVHLNAVWNAPEYHERYQVTPKASSPNAVIGDPNKLKMDSRFRGNDDASLFQTLLALLKDPIIASKEAVVRQYDHEVQGGSVIKPFMGPAQDGPTDACVFRPKLGSWKGVAVSNGFNPEVGKWDPYVMAKLAVDEALRNLIAVGGGLSHVAILDNFCWGDSKNAGDLGALVRASEGLKEAALAFELPFISGKDSFNNTWRDTLGVLHSIPPTLLISAIGLIRDVRECVTSGLKDAASLLYLVGITEDALKGSMAARILGEKRERLPDVDFVMAKTIFKKLQHAMGSRAVLACHDLSEGGLAVAAAEMAFGSALGLQLDLSAIGMEPYVTLFSESPSRFIVEVPGSRKVDFEVMMGARAVQLIGRVTKDASYVVLNKGSTLIKERVEDLKKAWKGALAQL